MYQKNTLSQRALNQKTTMKSISKKVPVVLLFSVLFTLLFFQKLIGINLLIFESILLLLASWLYKPKFNSLLSKSLLAGTILTLIFVVIHNSLISKVVNSASFLLLISNLISLDFTHIKSYLFQFIYKLMVKGETQIQKHCRIKTAGLVRYKKEYNSYVKEVGMDKDKIKKAGDNGKDEYYIKKLVIIFLFG